MRTRRSAVPFQILKKVNKKDNVFGTSRETRSFRVLHELRELASVTLLVVGHQTISWYGSVSSSSFLSFKDLGGFNVVGSSIAALSTMVCERGY